MKTFTFELYSEFIFTFHDKLLKDFHEFRNKLHLNFFTILCLFTIKCTLVVEIRIIL